MEEGGHLGTGDAAARTPGRPPSATCVTFGGSVSLPTYTGTKWFSSTVVRSPTTVETPAPRQTEGDHLSARTCYGV